MGQRVRGSGDLVDRDFDQEDFSALAISDTFHATIEPGPEFRVQVTADDNILDYVRVRQYDNLLEIGMDADGVRLSDVTTRVHIVMPKLEALAISGVARANVGDLPPVPHFEIGLSGVSQGVGSFQAQELTIDCSGTAHWAGAMRGESVRVHSAGVCDLDLEVMAEDLTVRGDGVGNLDLRPGAVTHADVQLSGTLKAKVDAREVRAVLRGVTALEAFGVERLPEVELSGASYLTYSGPNPTVGRVHTSGLSKLRQRSELR